MPLETLAAFVIQAGRAHPVTLRPDAQTAAVLISPCAALRALAHLVLLRENAAHA